MGSVPFKCLALIFARLGVFVASNHIFVNGVQNFSLIGRESKKVRHRA